MSVKSIIKYLLIWQVLITAVVVWSAGVLPLRKSDSYLGGGIDKYINNPLLNFRSNFDGVHYILIATHGYNYGQQAFFPLYPDVIGYVYKYLRDPVLVGTLISCLSFLVACIYLFRLIQLDYPKITAKWTFIVLLIFPTSFIFSSVYTESLFIMLTVLAFYSARKSNWLLAGIFGGLASYTRFVGIFLFPALLMELFIQSRNTKIRLKSLLVKALPLLLIVLGLGTYMFYLFKTTGDPLAFYHVQVDFFQSRSPRIIMPYQVFWRYIKMVLTVSRTDFLYLTIWFEFLTGIFFFALAALSLFKQRLSYAFFSISACLLPTLTGNFVSLPRYVLICFPLFILIADFLRLHPKIRIGYLYASGFGLLLFLSLFARGYWVS